MNIISKNFRDMEIIFSTEFDRDLYLNATKVAKSFNKDVREWKRSKQAVEYINALSDVGFFHTTLVKTISGNFSDKREQGTWIHKKLIISFARWLSPDFAVWCDQQIEEILKSKSSQNSQPKENIDLDEILVISKKMLELASMFGLSRESRYISADSGVKRVTGNSPLELLGVSQRVSIEDMPII